MVSSSSSWPIIVSSSDDEEPESYSITLALPSELEKPPLSAILDHRELGKAPGESGTMGVFAELYKPLRGGIVMPPRPPTTGEESGDDCSARVEWWRLVQALEKSKPLDRRGRAEPGDPYEFDESSLGDNGTRLTKFAVLVLLMSRGGICRLRPRGGWFGLLGVTGVLEGIWMSSLDVLASRKGGDGERTAWIPSVDHGRGLRGDLETSIPGLVVRGRS